ncbi:MAG TPA: acyl-CoA dehydrogenase family protein, partial [Thermoanaerobaculia bacterium]
MDFELGDRARSLAALARDFVAADVVPVERAFLAAGWRAVERALPRLRARAKSLGLLVPHLPAEYGGGGLSLVEFAAVGEELGRSILGHLAANCQAPDAGNMELLLHHGSAAQKERWLAPLAAGAVRSCFAMTEPERAGSNPTWLETRARRRPDGGYLLDGHKWFTSGADGAAFAVVMAVTDPQAPPHRRASLLVVP